MPRIQPFTCPFCGALPIVRPKDPNMEGSGWGEVSCNNKRCPVRPRATYYGDYRPKTVAVKRWNQRAKATINCKDRGVTKCL